MKLVCITGIDGTGKTTLARNTAAALGGAASRRSRSTAAPTRCSRALMALGRAAMLRDKDQWRDYAGYTADKKRTMRNPLLAATYTAAILLDYYVQLWLKLLPHLFTGRVVVSDRYLYDTIISDSTVHLGYTAAQTARPTPTPPGPRSSPG